MHLAPNGTDVGSATDLLGSVPVMQRPLLTLDIRNGVSVGREAAGEKRFIEVEPFAECEMFVRRAHIRIAPTIPAL